MQKVKVVFDATTGTYEELPLTPEELALTEVTVGTYAELRAMEYPDFRDYLDGVVKNDQEQIQAYIDACLAVKAKYPKP